MSPELYDRLGDIAFAFLSILFEGAPFIFVGTLISGFIDAYLPPGLIDRWLPKKRALAVMVSGLMGGVFPVCECAIVPVIRRLIQKGLPISCAITYMLSAPIINPIVVVSTLSAFSGQDAGFMAASRLIIAYMVTVFVGLVVLRFSPKDILRPSVYQGLKASGESRAAPARAPEGGPAESDGEEPGHDHHHDEHAHAKEGGHEHGHAHDEPPVAEARLVLAMRSAMRDFLDTAMFFSIGVLITAVFNTQVSQDLIIPLAQNEWLAVGSMMSLGFILSLCSTSDAFIAATLAAFSYYAKLAFLVYGPMMDVKLLFMYASVFRKRFVFILAVSLFILIGLICVRWGVVRTLYG